MTQTKTVSTRIDEKIYNSLMDYCNLQGKTISQIMYDLLIHVLEKDKGVHANSMKNKEHELSKSSVEEKVKDMTLEQLVKHLGMSKKQ
ncbi:MAG: hypothetical protein EXS77_05395 [Nitrosopumilus sp.]|nr:hypothetical protein [Nitrosopumilus sp.]